MGKTVITPKIEAFIKANYLKKPIRQMSNDLGISRDAVIRFMRINNLIVPPETIKQFRSIAAQKPFTAKQNKIIIDNIKNLSMKEIGKLIKRSCTTVMKQAHLLGLSNIIENKKQNTRFKKGHLSFNKGKKQTEYMSVKSIESSSKTRFKKGLTPPNSLPAGAEVLRMDKNKRNYWMIKLPKETKLKFKHIHIWETHNGKVPKGYNVVFKDGNPENCILENLECISDKELMSRNTLHNYPPEITHLIQLKGALNRQINKQQKS